MMTNHTTTFISASAPSGEGDPAPYFRREFRVDPDLREATLTVTALGIVEPYVNGARVGDEVLAPGWTSYRHRVGTRTHDVTELVAAGGNAIGAIVGEGWAVGALTWENNRHNYADRPALHLTLTLRYDDRAETISSDESFTVGTGAVLSSGLYAGEHYDARAEPSGWAEAGFDDSAWQPATPLVWNAELIDDAAPPIVRHEALVPVAITTSPSGRTIVDFGQILSGWVRLTVTGETGRLITLRHAELLTPEGELETETLRSAAATDRYVLRGEGAETWEPRFTFHGFRYAEIEGWPGTLEIDDLRAVVVHSEMERRGWFESSDPLLSRLHENVLWSMRGNFVGVPTDCPQRDERLGWTGDMNAFAPTSTFLYDVRGVLGSWLQDLAIEQHETGTVPWTVPDVLPTSSSAAALWSDVAVSLPWQLYQEYGEIGILERSYPSMVAYIDEVEPLLDDDGLWGSGFQFGDWLDPDAPASNPAGGKTDRYLVASAYLVKTTRELASAAHVLGRADDEVRFTELAQRVRDAFRNEFVTSNGRIISESATGYALPIMFDLLDDRQRELAGRRLAEIVEASDYTIATGFAGTPLVTHALSSTGHTEAAYRLLTQTKSPSFLYPVTMGATTIWERWDSVLPDGRVNATGMTSLNHYALGAVADWMHQNIGGLRRTSPGWKTFTVAPELGGGQTAASARHLTPLGLAESRWQVIDGALVLDVIVPDGASATIRPPLHPDGLEQEVAAGSHSWRYDLPLGFGKEDQLSLQSPLKDVQRDETAWAGVLAVLRRFFPGVPIEAAGSHLGGVPLGMLAERMPEEHREHLRAALQSALDTR